MKYILLLLCKTEVLTRNDIVLRLEEKRGKIFTRSKISEEYVLVDNIRVSYDRTLRHLRNLRLLEGYFPPELAPLSPYQGTLWQGYAYKRTPKGKSIAEKLEKELLESIEDFSYILHGRLFS